MKKLIETTLPLRTISESAINDSARGGHPGNLHLWWNRSPIKSSAAVLHAVLTDDNPDNRAQLLDKIKSFCYDSSDNAFSREEMPTLVDPFSGFGGLAIAGQSENVNVMASDLNSVAVLLTKSVAEIPALFKDCQPVSEDSCPKFYVGTEGLAEDIHCYGEWVRDQLFEIMKPHYPDINIQENENVPVYSWVWTRTVKCPNPACGCEMPAASSFVLSKLKNNEYWAEPILVDKQLNFLVHQGICPQEKTSNKYETKGAKFRCPFCGEITSDEYMHNAGVQKKLGTKIMAVGYIRGKKKIFMSPSKEQILAANTVEAEGPLGDIPNNTRWFGTIPFGFTTFNDLFTSRQLLFLTSLSDLIVKAQEKATKDALSAGFSSDACPLEQGGKGALAYGQAIGVYLTFLLDKITCFQSTICTVDNRAGNIRTVFTRQAIPMTWVFGEGNPFSSVTGNYDSALAAIVKAIEQLNISKPAKVSCANAIEISFPKNSILFTELPYYDNVGYADLSDYFYVWMRRTLKDTYPSLFEGIVSSKEELTSIAEHYDGDSEKAKSAYRDGLMKLFNHFYPSASTDYPSVVFYELCKEDEESLNRIGNHPFSPLEYLLSIILNAGFAVTALYPIRSEKPDERFESFRITIILRKQVEVLPKTTRRNFITTLIRDLSSLLDDVYSSEIDDADKIFSGLGCGLSIFTRFEKIINADGSTMNIHDALQIIYQEVNAYLAKNNDGCGENVVIKED